MSPTPTLTAGIIEVAGDFIQYNTTSDESFVSTGTRVILSGGVQQSLDFDSPGPTGSGFTDLDIDNAGGVQLQTDVYVDNDLNVLQSVPVGNLGGQTVTVGGDLTTVASSDLTVDALVIGQTLTIGGTFSVATTTFAGPGQIMPVLPYQNLGIEADIALASPVTATGQLISSSAATPTVDGAGNALTVSGLAVDGLVLDNVPLTSAGGTIGGLDNVTFQGYAGTATQLTISHPGAASPFTFDNVSFTSTPTTGYYVDATDTAPTDGLVFTINLTNSVPGNGTPFTMTTDDVGITVDGTYTVTLDVDATVASLTLGGGTGTATLTASNRTLTLNGTSTVETTGALTLTSTTVDGTGILTNNGLTTVLPGNSAIEVQFAQEGMLRLNGNNGDAFLVVDQPFINRGTIELTKTSWSGRLTVNNGTLDNGTSGIVQAVAGVANRITGIVNNQGMLSVQAPLQVLNTGTFTSTAGALDVASTLELNGGTVVVGSGTGLVGTGSINLTGSPTLSFPSAFTLASGDPTWQFGGTNGVTVDGPGSLVNEVSLSLQNDLVNANVTLNNTGTGTLLVLPGTSAINGPLTQAGTLRLNGNNGDAALVVDQAFTNSGTLELTGTSWSGRLTVTNGALTNTGTVQTVAGAANRITGAVDNQGTLLVQSPLTVFNNLQTFTSTDGTLNVAGGETLVINNGTVVVGSGTGLAGTGMINLTGSPTLSLLTTFTLASGEPTWQFGGTNGVTVDGPGLVGQRGIPEPAKRCVQRERYVEQHGNGVGVAGDERDQRAVHAGGHAAAEREQWRCGPGRGLGVHQRGDARADRDELGRRADSHDGTLTNDALGTIRQWRARITGSSGQWTTPGP